MKTRQNLLVLQDTEASQSLMLRDILPLSVLFFTGNNVRIQGIQLEVKSISLHVSLHNELVSRPVIVGAMSFAS